jgi:chromate transporter
MPAMRHMTGLQTTPGLNPVINQSELSNPVDLSKPDFVEAFWVWAKIGLLSFGGPAAQIALMHKIIVEEKAWLSEKQYLNALSFCMLLPGPEAMQLATYAGWRLHGTVGGLTAGLLFLLPGAIIILVLAAVYATFGNLPLTNALFLGIKAAVLIVVVEALLRVAKRALSLPEHWVIAALAFFGIFILELPYPLIIAASAIYGFIRGGAVEATGTPPQQLKRLLPATLATITIWLMIWWLPVLSMGYFIDQPILSEIGAFFSKLAIVTFGGAYAVLAYLAQDVVNQYGWLSAGEMMDGLGLAETTPGPLILVTEFVGFIAGFREGGILLGLAAAIVTLWVTFVPCFLWIFAGAPYIEWIGAQPRLRGALTGITAAVVGVILNLSLWFSMHVLFKNVDATQYGPFKIWQPELSSVDWRVIVLSAICAWLTFKLHWNILYVLGISSALGVALTLSG